MSFSQKIAKSTRVAFFASCCDHCPRCGSALPLSFEKPPPFYRPWKMDGPKAVVQYVNSLAEELREWLLVFFVDDELSLLAAETVGRGSVSDVKVDFAGIMRCGQMLSAAGIILVHNHPSGDPQPSSIDVKVTRRMAQISREMEIPLLDHFVIARNGMQRIGGW